MARAVIERIEELTEVAQANPGKNPLAVALGRRGGLKGGPARQAQLSREERRQLGLKGAKARWGKKR